MAFCVRRSFCSGLLQLAIYRVVSHSWCWNFGLIIKFFWGEPTWGMLDNCWTWLLERPRSKKKKSTHRRTNFTWRPLVTLQDTSRETCFPKTLCGQAWLGGPKELSPLSFVLKLALFKKQLPLLKTKFSCTQAFSSRTQEASWSWRIVLSLKPTLAT